ncbi:MAG: hypothetical protein A2W91_14995 [Bacteroidetes bacterium GWF2_38_335]|nr:MAG: hypothetical protein A2W91_14995 [Bacteroidetes bacterium GWF2_38_335]OFY78504.1 MAG: hypothetical protein A2281_16305 [Bacteroidetes bacterium RIFOXYA12_FULL_38_20]HBS88453.1 membrane-bound O-acyltransferase family protein [Bacteroidales bacterium]
MQFNSFAFLYFVIVVFTLYWSFARKVKVQNVILLAASYVFYGWWDWRFLFLIFASSMIDFILAAKIFSAQSKPKRKLFLTLSLTLNLGLLFFYKYFDFFAASFIELCNTFGYHPDAFTTNVILPVGISFYTFQTLSYTIDIYYKNLEPTRNIVSFFAYVSFFPQLVAGPIERAKNLLPQFFAARFFDKKTASAGLRLILYGLFKKIVIADNLAATVESVYSSPEGAGSISIIIATIFFGIQIYCDFSGYSDIAIGTARLFGFELMKNFKTPYLSFSFSEFWRRWHISLSTWFRDYLYIPLGGNKNGVSKHIRNLVITFVVSGLWHGASWTFVAWGFLHAAFLSVETLLKIRTPQAKSFVNYIYAAFVFLAVMFLWIFFRASSIGNAFLIIDQLNNFQIGFNTAFVFPLSLDYTVLLLVLGGFIIIDVLIGKDDFSILAGSIPKVFRWILYYVLLFAIIFFGRYDAAPEFIYFQF